MDKKKIKRTLIREGIILGVVILIAWILYSVGTYLDKTANLSEKIITENDYNIRLTYEIVYTTAQNQGKKSYWVGRIAGRTGWIEKGGEHIMTLDEAEKEEIKEYTDKEVEAIKKAIKTQEQRQKQIVIFSYILIRFVLLLVVSYFIYLFILFFIWVAYHKSNIIAKSKKILHIAMSKDFLIRTTLILGIIFLAVSILKSCGFIERF